MYLFKTTLFFITPVLFCLPIDRVLGEEPPATPLIPQTLLKLIHAPEVQEELASTRRRKLAERTA